MATKKIPVEEASVDQLRYFAVTEMGLELRGNASRATIFTALENASIDTSDGITVEVGKEETVDAAAFGKKMPMPKDIADAPRVRILVHQQEGGQDPIPISVNGYSISIRRGVEVAIPMAHYEVLENAQEQFFPVDEDGNITSVPESRPRYPHSFYGTVAKEAA